jgi:hypothetical protein
MVDRGGEKRGKRNNKEEKGITKKRWVVYFLVCSLVAICVVCVVDQIRYKWLTVVTLWLIQLPASRQNK